MWSMWRRRRTDTDMYRIPLGTAKQLLDGASVYRLLSFPEGRKRLRLLRLSGRASGMSIIRSLPVTPEGPGRA